MRPDSHRGNSFEGLFEASSSRQERKLTRSFQPECTRSHRRSDGRARCGWRPKLSPSSEVAIHQALKRNLRPAVTNPGAGHFVSWATHLLASRDFGRRSVLHHFALGSEADAPFFPADVLTLGLTVVQAPAKVCCTPVAAISPPRCPLFPSASGAQARSLPPAHLTRHARKSSRLP